MDNSKIYYKKEVKGNYLNFLKIDEGKNYQIKVKGTNLVMEIEEYEGVQVLNVYKQLGLGGKYVKMYIGGNYGGVQDLVKVLEVYSKDKHKRKGYKFLGKNDGYEYEHLKKVFGEDMLGKEKALKKVLK